MSIFLIVGVLFAYSVVCDVSNLNNIYFEPLHDYYYQLPHIPVSTIPPPPSPPLPEIIINKRIKSSGYNYQKPEIGYIPPQNIPAQFPDEHIPSSPTSNPGLFPPIVVDDLHVPISEDNPHNQEYLPPIASYPKKDQDYKNGYNYNVPPTTTTTTSPILAAFPELPPELDPSEIPNQHPGYVYNPPPVQQPAITYLPTTVTERLGKDLPDVVPKNQIRLQIAEMRCMLSQSGYFKSALKIDSFLSAVPILDNYIPDTRCDLHLQRSYLLIDIAAEDFQRCGIFHCATNNLCLRIRFPLIRGMETADDSILTLQCKIQDRVVSKTHALKMAISSNVIQGRSVGAYAHGGNQQPFRTHIELLKKSPNGMSRILEPNGVVQLGEDLQLRAQIHEGDGWNYTRLSDVLLQRVSSSGEILNSATLITPSGCVNPSMRIICPLPPIFDPPLGHRFSFKAIMFQGMKSGDEILMTIKIIGCIQKNDCFANEAACENDQKIIAARHKRDAKQNNNTNSSAMRYADVSTIFFRVELPKLQPSSSSSSYEDFTATEYFLIAAGIVIFVCPFCSLIAVASLKIKIF